MCSSKVPNCTDMSVHPRGGCAPLLGSCTHAGQPLHGQEMADALQIKLSNGPTFPALQDLCSAVKGYTWILLALQGCAFQTLVIHAPALLSLDMRDSQKISDVALRSTLTHLTSLRALDLSYIVPLSDDTLREVCAKAPPPCPIVHRAGE